MRRGPRIGALVLALAALPGACSVPPPNTVVNGWSIGEQLACTDERCAAQIPVARAALAELYRDHPIVVEMRIHEEGGYRNPDGTVAVPFRSGGCCDVAVFHFADGSLFAFGVGYPGISQEPVAVPAGPMELVDPPR